MKMKIIDDQTALPLFHDAKNHEDHDLKKLGTIQKSLIIFILGKMIQAAYIPEKNYFELFPDAATTETILVATK